MNKEHKNIKAIRILEFIAGRLGKEKIFDGELWYELEGGIMAILKNKQQDRKTLTENELDIVDNQEGKVCEQCGKPAIKREVLCENCLGIK